MTKPEDKPDDALLPCPCCGGEAQFSFVDDERDKNFDGRFVHCIECELSTNLQFALKGDVRRELAERWNKRPAATVPECGALKALSDAATPGVWKVAGDQNDLVYTAENVPVARIVNTQVFMRGGKTAGAWAPNADFIVALVNAYRNGTALSATQTLNGGPLERAAGRPGAEVTAAPIIPSTSGALTLELADELFGAFLRPISGGGYYCVHCDEPIEPDDWINGTHSPDCIVEKARVYLKVHKPAAIVSARPFMPPGAVEDYEASVDRPADTTGAKK